MGEDSYHLRIGRYTFTPSLKVPYERLTEMSLWYCSRRRRGHCKASVKMINGEIAGQSGSHNHAPRRHKAIEIIEPFN